MKGYLFVGGLGPSQDKIAPYLQQRGTFVAADSGFDLALEYNIRPDIVVGDMDSLKNRSMLKDYPQENIYIFPQDKDETDTEIGLRLLYEQGIKDITLIGGGGGRLDHLLGIIVLFEREIHPAEWFTEKEHIVFIDSEYAFACEKDERISLFPLGSVPCTMRSQGLKWPLDQLQWHRGDAGISNRAAAKRVSIAINSGKLLLVKNIT